MLPGRRPLLEPFRPALKSRALRLVHFADRCQGLIVAYRQSLAYPFTPGSDAPYGSVHQPASGLGDAAVLRCAARGASHSAAQITGYRHEEFTHAAVAAMIASGSADAAFGIEAAATRHGLSFVPMAQERYFLAMHVAVVARPAVEALLGALQSRWFRKLVHELPGYARLMQRAPVPVAEVFERWSA